MIFFSFWPQNLLFDSNYTNCFGFVICKTIPWAGIRSTKCLFTFLKPSYRSFCLLPLQLTSAKKNKKLLKSVYTFAKVRKCV